MTNVSFLQDDSRLVSTGGADTSVLQWIVNWTDRPEQIILLSALQDRAEKRNHRYIVWNGKKHILCRIIYLIAAIAAPILKRIKTKDDLNTSTFRRALSSLSDVNSTRMSRVRLHRLLHVSVCVIALTVSLIMYNYAQHQDGRLHIPARPTWLLWERRSLLNCSSNNSCARHFIDSSVVCLLVLAIAALLYFCTINLSFSLVIYRIM